MVGQFLNFGNTYWHEIIKEHTSGFDYTFWFKADSYYSPNMVDVGKDNLSKHVRYLSHNARLINHVIIWSLDEIFYEYRGQVDNIFIHSEQSFTTLLLLVEERKNLRSSTAALKSWLS